MSHSPIFLILNFRDIRPKVWDILKKTIESSQMSQFHKNQKKIKNLEILFRRETFSGSLRLWVSRKNNFGCWVILSCRLVLYFSAETNEKEINVENQKSEKSREIFQPAERSLLTCGNFNPFSTWRGDVWFDLESFLNDLIDDRRIWPFWTFLEHFSEGFYGFSFTCPPWRAHMYRNRYRKWILLFKN